MTMFRKTVLAAAVGLLAVSTIPAAAQSRIGYVDAEQLLKKMPDAMDAESHLDQIVEQWNKQIADMQSELDRKQADYDRRKLIMSDGERHAAELDLADLKKRIDDFRQKKYGPHGELMTQQDQLMKPAYDKLNQAIEAVALDDKYDYVFDKSSKELALLYTNKKFDLTAEVAKKLGIETNDIFSVPLIDNKNKPGTQPNNQVNRNNNYNPNNPNNTSNPGQSAQPGAPPPNGQPPFGQPGSQQPQPPTPPPPVIH